MNKKLLNIVIGLSAIIFPFLHSLTDVMEIANKGFSMPQMLLNYIAFLFIPLMVIGLFAYQWKKAGWLGFIGALLYSLSFIYFESTTVYVMINKTVDYQKLLDELGFFYFFNGGLMVVGGIMLGISILKYRFLPAYSAIILIIGLLINAIVAFIPVPDIFQTLGSAFRNIAFICMGIDIIRKEAKGI
jgi:hypothetical protein